VNGNKKIFAKTVPFSIKDGASGLFYSIKRFFILMGKFFSAVFAYIVYGVKKFFSAVGSLFKNPMIHSESTKYPSKHVMDFDEPVDPSDEVFRSQVKPGGKHTADRTAVFSSKGVTTSGKALFPASDDASRHVSIFKPREKKPSFIVGVVLTTAKILFVLIFMMGAGVFGLLWGVAKAYMETTPNLDVQKLENQSVNSYIYDANDKLITVFTGTENREWVALSEIPKMLQNAFIAVEDIRFEYHNGIDIKRIVGAFVSNTFNGSSRGGGSTITQQLIKIRLLTMEQTYKRKIQEAYLAMQLETEYSKNEILESYLNTIPLGGVNYGVKTAAKDYFNKDLKDLTLREAACLAGITTSPSSLNPRRAYYVTKNTKPLNDRVDFALKRMYEANYISKAQYEAALADKLKVVQKSTVNEMYKYPYFVEYAVNDVITHLLAQRNKQDTKENRTAVENEIRTQGYKIYTTLDPAIQETVQETLSTYKKYPQVANSSDSVIRYTNSSGTTSQVIQPQAAAVVYDYHKGELKAIIGGRDEPTLKKSLNRAYQTSMPVGSSIKPLSVYAPAIEKGASPASIVDNVPAAITGWNAGKGYPATSSKTYGPITLRTGLVKSLNIATARTLMDRVGINDSKSYLVSLGVNPDHINADGPGLALGTSGITPVEMAVAYGAIANKGLYKEAYSFRKVVDRDGNVILDAEKLRVQRQVFKPSTAFMVTDMLINAVKSGTGSKAKIKGMTVGGKTGTNQDNRGVFFAGITPYYSATVWIGQDNYKPLTGGIAASSTAAPLWQAFMSKVLKDKADKKIIEDSYESLGLVKVKVCSVSGMLATDACELDIDGHKPVTDYFLKGTQPTEECTLHHTFDFCKETGKLANEYCPSDERVKHSLVFPLVDSLLYKYGKLNAGLKIPEEAFEEDFDFSEFSESNPLFASLYCTLHTEDWYKNTYLKPEAVTAAKKVITDVKNNIAAYTLMMSDEEKSTLQEMITTLEAMFKDASATAPQIEDKTTELKNTAGDIFSAYQ
jgi:penicillin-binding protein 1A